MSGSDPHTAEPSLTHFAAPWCTRVRVTTAAGVILLLVVARSLEGTVTWLPLTLLLGASLLSVRGYSIRAGSVLVHRLGWSTTIPLEELKDVRVDPGVTRGSIRTFGNGGLFGFVGHFRNGVLGAYRAYLTDPDLAVVLDLGSRRVVVSPERPNLFAEEVRRAAGVT
jgi:hypothetical protein